MLPKTTQITYQQQQGFFISLEDWDNFLKEYQKIEKITNLRAGLKDVFQEVKDIQTEKQSYITMEKFLDKY
ncbi:MAG: hypothetical protein EAZ44_04515 [Cytophagia bacterium]|nr:MAG: hypothetical protein EAZ44_04515 [Cytophagia bacterium]